VLTCAYMCLQVLVSNSELPYWCVCLCYYCWTSWEFYQQLQCYKTRVWAATGKETTTHFILPLKQYILILVTHMLS